MLNEIKLDSELFGDFLLANLARVNLIVGSNNSGKTSLLKAISQLNENRVVYLDVNPSQNTQLLSSIALNEKKRKVVEFLQIIEPELENISFSNSQGEEPIRLKKKRLDYPIPLSSMGKGIYRLLILSISVLAAENEILLVDEIETGLHYEAQTDMWRLIIKTAKELNVQVFATTHSWDCLAAFGEAFSQVEDKSLGKLFRLERKYGKLRAVEYNTEDLDMAVRESLEVR